MRVDMHVGVMAFLILVKSILVLPGLELNLWGVSHTQTNLSPGAALLGQEAPHSCPCHPAPEITDPTSCLCDSTGSRDRLRRIPCPSSGSCNQALWLLRLETSALRFPG